MRKLSKPYIFTLRNSIVTKMTDLSDLIDGSTKQSVKITALAQAENYTKQLYIWGFVLKLSYRTLIIYVSSQSSKSVTPFVLVYDWSPYNSERDTSYPNNSFYDEG